MNWGLSDYLFMGGATAASYGWGWLAGAPIRVPTAQTFAIIGSMGAFLYCYSKTSFRLMGEIP